MGWKKRETTNDINEQTFAFSYSKKQQVES